jgi:hypothetical protein
MSQDEATLSIKIRMIGQVNDLVGVCPSTSVDRH